MVEFSRLSGDCRYTLDLYRTVQFETVFAGPLATAMAYFAISIFCIALALAIQNVMIYKRNRVMIMNAARTNTMLTSLFPTQIRDRMIENQEEAGGKRIGLLRAMTSGNFNNNVGDQPMADLFLDTTVLVSSMF